MSLPRCGVRDKVGFGNDNRSKRYALQGSRWRVKALTYKISKYPKRLKKADVDAEISRAFAVWGEYTDLTFTPKTSGPVHIEIKYVYISLSSSHFKAFIKVCSHISGLWKANMVMVMHSMV